jgi:hypothetical protein
MEINKAKFERVVKEAKVVGNKRWENAIDKAADAILNGKWIITELQHCIAVTTESGQTYRANNKHCQCEAFFRAYPLQTYRGTPPDRTLQRGVRCGRLPRRDHRRHQVNLV